MNAETISIVSDKLLALKKSGIPFKVIANTIGVPKERISEAYRKRYLGKRTLKLLIAYGYVKNEDVSRQA